MSLLLFQKRFLPAIRAGEKSTTVRRWKSPRVTPGGRAYSPGLGWLAIDYVAPIRLQSLTNLDARADGFTTAAQMRKELRRLYPDLKSDGKTWFLVRFRYAAESV